MTEHPHAVITFLHGVVEVRVSYICAAEDGWMVIEG